MAGQKFQYDESGSTFMYFVLSFLGLILIPSTYYFWPNQDKADEKKKKDIGCNCEPCLVKEGMLKKNEPRKKLKKLAIRIAITFGWVIFAFVAYKITQAEYEYANFDPYEILGVELSASTSEIKRSYRELSKIHHPDKPTGDEKLFMKIRKAYQALTDETSKRNWERYGNPDGPGAMSFGIALPSWIVDKENSVWVLGLYALVFMVALPTSVGIWWYRSIQYSSDKVLLDTTQLYYYFFHKTPQMVLKRAVMVLAASLEFEKGHNSQITERPTDNVEVPQLIKQLPLLNEKNKERPLCFYYSIKARSLIHAHLARMDLPPNSLELDRQFVMKKCPYLIQEMVTCVSQLIMLAHAGRIGRLPTLETIENVMKMSPMMVQALWDNKSPLLQLPHITEDMQKYFLSKKRQLRTIQQFCQLKEVERRALFKVLKEDQYSDVMRVCESMPLIDFKVHVEVLDDEESTVVTAGAIVTVTVTLTRNTLRSLISGDSHASKHSGTSANHIDEEYANEEDKENKDEDGVAQSQNKKPVWQKKGKGGGKKSGGNKNKSQQSAKKVIPKSSTTSSPKPSKNNSNNEDGDDDRKELQELPEIIEDDSDSNRDSDNERDSENDIESDESSGQDKEKTMSSVEDDDAEWEKCQQKLAKSKERALEGKSKISHNVHCPYFPDDKQEYWWTYVCDKKNKMLVTAPFLVTDLVTTEEASLQFTAPRKTGHYTFTVCLRSDSYIGFDQFREIKLDVQEAKEIEEHPQWDISDEEEENAEKTEESEYATDDDIGSDEDASD